MRAYSTERGLLPIFISRVGGFVEGGSFQREALSIGRPIRGFAVFILAHIL